MAAALRPPATPGSGCGGRAPTRGAAGRRAMVPPRPAVAGAAAGRPASASSSSASSSPAATPPPPLPPLTLLAADVREAPPASRPGVGGGGGGDDEDAARSRAQSSAGGAPGPSGRPDGPDPDFFVNVGHAIRTLREDIPALFEREMDCELATFFFWWEEEERKIGGAGRAPRAARATNLTHGRPPSLLSSLPLSPLPGSIYRDDVVFRDPRNCFKGLKNYKIIFWSLRFHGAKF